MRIRILFAILDHIHIKWRDRQWVDRQDKARQDDQTRHDRRLLTDLRRGKRQLS